MATAAIPVFEGSVKWGTDSSNLSAIPEVTTLILPQVDVNYVDVTSLDSSGWREFVATLKDAGQIEVPCMYRHALVDSAWTYMVDGTLVWLESELATASDQTAGGDTFLMQGFVRASFPAEAIEGVSKMNLNFRLSGAPIYTEGT